MCIFSRQYKKLILKNIHARYRLEVQSSTKPLLHNDAVRFDLCAFSTFETPNVSYIFVLVDPLEIPHVQ